MAASQGGHGAGCRPTSRRRSLRRRFPDRPLSPFIEEDSRGGASCLPRPLPASSPRPGTPKSRRACRIGRPSRSAAGVGLDDFRRSKPWRPPSLILEADPPLHTRSRTVLNRALSAKAMAALRAAISGGGRKPRRCAGWSNEIDAIAEIAEAYPLSVFSRRDRAWPGRAGKPAALWRDGVQRVRAAQRPFRGLDARRRPRRRLDQRAMREGGAGARRARRGRLGRRRFRRDHSRRGAVARPLAADGGARYDNHRHRQRPLCAGRQPGGMAQAARQSGAAAARLRRDAALRIAGADLLPNDDAAKRRSAASPCRRTPKSCCFSPAPIAIRAAGRTRTAST